jgi:hypothetical protein
MRSIEKITIRKDPVRREQRGWAVSVIYVISETSFSPVEECASFHIRQPIAYISCEFVDCWRWLDVEKDTRTDVTRQQRIRITPRDHHPRV